MTNKERLEKALESLQTPIYIDSEARHIFHLLFDDCQKSELKLVANSGLRHRFYCAYVEVYGINMALSFFFYNDKKVDSLRDKITSLEEDVKEGDIYGKACEAQISDLNKEKEQVTKALFDVAEERDEARKQLDLKDQEIIALKAKLYDFMTK